MAILYGENHVGRVHGESTDFPPVRIPPGEEVGDVGMAYDYFKVPTTALNTNDIIKMMFLPKGFRIKDAILKFEAFGGAAAVDVGFFNPATQDLAATGELLDGIAIDSAGHTTMLAQTTTPIGLLHEVSESTPGYNPDIGGVEVAVKFTTAGPATEVMLELATFSVGH